MRQLIISLLCFVTLTAIFPHSVCGDVYVYADKNEKIELQFKVNDSNELTLTRVEHNGVLNEPVIINDTITINGKKYTIIDIESYSFYGKSKFPVTVNNVKKITKIHGDISSITLNNVEWVNSTAFKGNWYLKKVNWGSSWRWGDEVPALMFDDTGIESFDFTGFKKIGEGAFSNTLLTEIDLKDVTFVGGGAFQRTNLTNVKAPKLTKIDYRAFEGNRSLKYVELPEVREIGYCAFLETPHLDSINAPKLEKIGKNAFEKSGITKLISPQLAEIGENAFYLSNITEIELGDKCKEIGPRTFYMAEKLANIKVSNLEKICDEGFYKTALQSIDLSNVKAIGNYAFSYTQLKRVNLSALDSLGDYAFGACDKLVDVIMPDSLKKLGDYAFRYAESLKSLDLKNTVIDKSNYNIVRGCTRLKTLTGKNIEEIGKLSLSGTNITELVNFPKIKYLYRPFESGKRVSKIDLPSAAHIDLNDMFIDTLVVGNNLVDHYYSLFDYYLLYIPGLQIGNSWVGHFELSPGNNLYNIDKANRLSRRSKENLGVKTYSMSNLLNTTDFKILDKRPENLEEPPYSYRYLTYYIGRGEPEKPYKLYRTSDHTPGGTLICDKVDTVYINSPINPYSLNVKNGSMFNFEYYHPISFLMYKPAKDHYTRVYLDPDFEIPNYSKQDYIDCLVSSFFDTYYTNRFLLITAADDKEGIIEKLRREWLASVGEVTADENENNHAPEGIYNLQGVRLSPTATEADINALTPGLYIINGKKIMIRR